MGRYYGAGDHYMKFWFAVQPSDDPETVYGMKEDKDAYEEDEECCGYIEYATDNGEYVRKQLDKQYDILNVKKEDRLYAAKTDKEIFDYFNKVIDKIIYTDKKTNEEDWSYYMGEGKPTMYAVSDEYMLAASRVELGIVILSEIKDNGKCWLSAEY